MAITAAQVKQLREATGAGMMDCKKALMETNGDMDAAVEVLRKKGQAKAEKKASRIAAEGICLIATDGDQKAAVVEVNSETDFVAQNEKFRTYVAKVADQALKTDAKDIDAFMAEPWIEDGSKTVSEALVDMIAVIIDAKTGVVNDAVKEALTNVAMQVAAMSPKYVTVDEVPESYKEHEKEILLAQAIEENEKLPENKRKPQNIIEKMLIGRLNKELKQICLYDQVYVRAEDGKQTVAQYLQQVGKANGTDLSVRRFIRFETGEGIEKKVENFAEEVMSQIKH